MKIQPDSRSDSISGCPVVMDPVVAMKVTLLHCLSFHHGPKFGPVEGQSWERDTSTPARPCWCERAQPSPTQVRLVWKAHLGMLTGRKAAYSPRGFHVSYTSDFIPLKYGRSVL